MLPRKRKFNLQRYVARALDLLAALQAHVLTTLWWHSNDGMSVHRLRSSGHSSRGKCSSRGLCLLFSCSVLDAAC